MTDDELMKLAVEAGATRYASPDHPDRPRHTFNLSAMHRFVGLVLRRFAMHPVQVPDRYSAGGNFNPSPTNQKPPPPAAPPFQSDARQAPQDDFSGGKEV